MQLIASNNSIRREKKSKSGYCIVQDYHHGLRVIELNNGNRPIGTNSTAIIGMVCTARETDKKASPLNKPVLITDVQGAISQAWKTGILAPALQVIADQAKPDNSCSKS